MQHLKDGKWSQMSQKQVDKVKEGDNFKVRWFIKKEMTDENGETKLGFEFLPAKSEFLNIKKNFLFTFLESKNLQMFFRHPAHEAFHKKMLMMKEAGTLSDEQILKIRRAIHKDPKKVREKMRRFRDKKQIGTDFQINLLVKICIYFFLIR